MTDATSATEFQRLIISWRSEYPKRASGGAWAIAGFSFQISSFLLQLFKTLRSDAGLIHPVYMEELSDIVQQINGKVILIQAKRTLQNDTLKSIAEEGYIISDLCLRETPNLLGRLQLRIATRNNETTRKISDLNLKEVISGGKPDIWKHALQMFGDNPIVIDGDPIEQLRAFLWNDGIENVDSLIHRCQGVVLESFESPSNINSDQIAARLADLFFIERRREAWARPGDLLSLQDIQPSSTGTYREILTGQIPKLEHLRSGCFRQRQILFNSLWENFSRWQDTYSSTTLTKIPVFWIGGRSGDGKSVLLLQLIARHLSARPENPCILIDSPERLPIIIRYSLRGRMDSERSFG